MHRGARGIAAGILAAGGGLAVLAPGAFAQDDAKSEIEALRRRIEQLEAKSAGGGSGGGDAGSLEEALKKGTPTRKGSSLLKFYGFLRLDAIFDDSQPNNTQTIGWVLSEDPTVAGGADEDDADFTMHPRLTRFGFDLDGPKVASLADAKLTGKLEVDFYNSGLAGQSESRSALRMRHAYLNLDWGTSSALAGQTSEVISPLWPFVNPDMVNWGAGNLGDRRPQVRYTRNLAMEGDRKLTLAAMAGLTGAVDNQNADADGLRDGEAAAFPTLQGRAGFSLPMGKGRAEFGAWGHFARESTEGQFAGEDRFESTALGIDVHVPFAEAFYAKAEAWRGRNMDDVRGGVFQGINTTTGNEIHSQGGWLEVGWTATKTATVAAGFSEDNPDDGDLNAGGRERNRIWYGGVHFNFDPVECGIDYMHWHTAFKGQTGGLDNRIQAFVAYNF
jgi:hypothetical protein